MFKLGLDPVVFYLNKIEPKENIDDFFRKLQDLDLPGVNKCVIQRREVLVKQGSDMVWTDLPKEQISIETLIQEASPDFSAEIVLGLVQIDYSRHIECDYSYDLTTPEQEIFRHAGFFCSWDYSPEVESVFHASFGKDFEQFYRMAQKLRK